MKITNVKAMVAKGMTIGLLAGAFLIAAPKQADAQQFAVGVQVGYPYHYDPYRYDHWRAEEFRRHEAFVRHEEWVRAHEYGGYRYHAPYYYR